MNAQAPFYFKQFSLNHHASPMPIGIDSMLLGAWCKPPSKGNILDIGTGCGLLTFMCAQKSESAQITGIDISENAIAEAESNRLQSAWQARLKFLKQDLKSYLPPNPFDFIISNPPFFDLDKNKEQSQILERANARHQNQLSLKDLFSFAAAHLSTSGKMALVLPYNLWESLNDLVLENGLCIEHTLFIQPKKDKPIHRFLVAISKTTVPNKELNICDENTLVVRESNGAYSERYKILTRDFYLKEL